MVVYGPASAPPAYVFAPTDTADSVNHGSDLHAIDRQEIRALWAQLWVAQRSRLIINGNYDVWQRKGAGIQTCPTTFSRDTSFGPDRLFTLPAGATVTVQRDAATLPDSKSRFNAAIGGQASVTTVDHGQRIESSHRTRYKQSLTFSVWVLNTSGAAYTPTLRVDTPASADDWTTPTNRLSQALQSCVDTVWTRVSHTFDPSAFTNIDNGLSVYLRIPSGSSVAGDINRMAQFRLEPSAGLLPYLAPDPEDELWRAMYYCWVPAGDNLGAAAGVTLLSAGGYMFPRPMRAVPVVSQATYAVNAGSAGTVAAAGLNTRSAYLSNSANNWTTNAIVTLSGVISAELT